MLYWLHEELEEGIRAQERHTVEALGVLLRRAAEGKHLLLCGRPVLTALEGWGEEAQLDFRSRGALDELGRRLKDASGLLRSATVRIDVGPARWPSGWADHTRAVYQLPVTALDDMDAAAATTLLTEGQADGELFKTAGALLLSQRSRHPPYIQVRLELRLGGGNQIGEELRRVAERGAPVLCVVDSDVGAPSQPYPDKKTAFEALSALTALASPADVQVLPGREVENILPLPLLRAVLEPMDRVQWDRWSAKEDEGAFFPDERGRYAELKDWLPEGITARCAGHLADLSRRDAASLLFKADDGTWASLSRKVLDWGIGVRPVRLS